MTLGWCKYAEPSSGHFLTFSKPFNSVIYENIEQITRKNIENISFTREVKAYS